MTFFGKINNSFFSRTSKFFRQIFARHLQELSFYFSQFFSSESSLPKII